MKQKFVIIHPYCHEVEVETIPDKWCPNNNVYLMTDLTNENFLSLIAGIHEVEKDRNEWIRKYENVLQGLNYWRNKANEM